MEKTQLTTAPLGETGLEITRVGFGAWAIGGNGYEWGWGSQDDGIRSRPSSVRSTSA
jgi:aryl-alcohol dehydrogenase-like predicted oxidoreductase